MTKKKEKKNTFETHLSNVNGNLVFFITYDMCVSLASSSSNNTTTANSRATDANEACERTGAIDSNYCAVHAANNNATTRRSITTSTTIPNATRTDCSRNKSNAE